MKTGTIILISILVLVIVGGIVFYIYTKENNPIVQNNNSGLDKIESAINDKIQSEEVHTTPTCTSFTYSNWGTCSASGTQTRTVTTSSPSGCSGGNPALSRSCDYVSPTQCSNECSSGSKTCVGNGYKTCGNYDSDSCLEWSSVTSCSSSQTCSNGQCVASTTNGMYVIENAINQKLGK